MAENKHTPKAVTAGEEIIRILSGTLVKHRIPWDHGKEEKAIIKSVDAIIENRRPPEDESVGKLVEAARNVVLIFHTEAKTYEAMAMVMKLEAALAEYEKVNK